MMWHQRPSFPRDARDLQLLLLELQQLRDEQAHQRRVREEIRHLIGSAMKERATPAFQNFRVLT